MRPADLPPPDHFAHGTRARYVSGCRCDACREANRKYTQERARACARGEGNGLVDSTPARDHLKALSRKGVGYKSVAAASDVAATVLADVLSGAKERIRAHTERAILAVDEGAIADGALVSARPTWKLVRKMLAAGLTRGEIAQRLGCERYALQLGKVRVEARTEFAVRKLHSEVMRELEVERAVGEICPECGFSHGIERRRALLLRLLPCTAQDAQEAHPCIYGEESGSRLLYRDLRAVGAIREGGSWALRARRAA